MNNYNITIIIWVILLLFIIAYRYRYGIKLTLHMVYTVMKNPSILKSKEKLTVSAILDKEEPPTFSTESIKNRIVIYLNPTFAMIIPEYFKKTIQRKHSLFIENKTYSCTIKAKFVDDTYATLSTQFTYIFRSEDFNKPLFKNLKFDDSKPLDLAGLYGKFYKIINTLREDYMIENMEYIIIVFYPIHIPEKKVLLNINTLNLNKEFVSKKKNRAQFSKNFLPLTLNENKYGKRMFTTSSYKSSSERIFINENNKIIIYDITPNSTKKEIYDLNDELIQTIFDEKINDNTFTRLIDNLKLTIQNDDKVIKSEASIEFKTIKPLKKSTKSTFNRNLGSFDLETYLNTNKKNPQDKNTTNGTYEVYALGFSVVNKNIHEPLTKMYYLESNQTSDDLVLNCLNEMLQTRYNKHIFYTHNLGGFDVIFLLKIILVYNSKNDNYYKLKAVFRDKRILKLDISARISKAVENKITLMDSLNLLPDSLDRLSKHFSTTYKKSIFPYSFITDKTLYYIGSTPTIEYYHTPKKNLPLKDYNVLKCDVWNIRLETLKYLKNDLVSLLQIMYEFSKFIFNEFDIELTDSLTITSLALNIFLRHHLKDKKIPLINKMNIYKELKEGYFGGLSDVYIPYGEDLYYYDVNSLYPYQALNPMPGHECTYIEDFSGEGLNLEGLFGYFYAKIKTTDDYLGLLPKRHDGFLVHPTGEWEGLYFSPILEFAKQHGYEIKVMKGYNFNQVHNLFDSYVKQLYKIKSNSSGSIRLISKFLLNSLTGRFGMSLERNITRIVSQEEFFKLKATHAIFDDKWISEDKVIVTYSDSVSKSICEQHGLNYVEQLNNSNKDSEYVSTFNNVSVTISSSITSYSSIYMSKIKLLILSLGGKVYYTDTDSIVTNIKLPDNLVSNSELGKFKLECMIKRGYFVSAKTYCLVLTDEYTSEKNKGVIIKAKGVINTNLTEDDFIKLYNEETIKAIKVKSTKNYESGYVSIGSQEIDLAGDVFRKRQKIYENKTWVNTKPLHIIES